MNVGVLHWDFNSELSRTHVEVIEALGHKVIKFLSTESIPDYVDLVFIHGPFGSLVPVANQLLALPPQKHPMLVLWMSEQFWDPRLPTFIGQPLSQLRSFVERCAYYPTSNNLWHIRPGWHWPISKALRFRYYGDILWLQRTGLLSLLIVPSDWTANFLRQRGIPAFTAYNGYTSNLGADLQLERDIPVLWLGKPGSRRRQNLIQRIYRQLAAWGIEMMIVDGYEHPYVFGKDRTHLLNRTQIVLNILRKPWDSNYMRYLLAISNGALIVTEPTYQHAPFEPGKHMVVAHPEEMANSIAYYLTQQSERETITTQAYEFITTHLTLQQSVVRIFERINEDNHNET